MVKRRIGLLPDAHRQGFGAIKAWIGATHFRLRTLEKVRTEMSLHVLAYNLKRMIAILGVQPLIQSMRVA
jgi:hypothetical protein